MPNKTVTKLEARLLRQNAITRRLENQLYVARRLDARRQRDAWDNQCYALGMAVEDAMSTDWPSDRAQAFLQFLALIFSGADLAIALRGTTVGLAGPLPIKALHARRFRWGIATFKMCAGGQLPPKELEEIVCKYLDTRRRKYALDGIAAALSSRPAQTGETPRSPQIEKDDAERKSIPSAAVPYTAPPPLRLTSGRKARGPRRETGHPDLDMKDAHPIRFDALTNRRHKQTHPSQHNYVSAASKSDKGLRATVPGLCQTLWTQHPGLAEVPEFRRVIWWAV